MEAELAAAAQADEELERKESSATPNTISESNLDTQEDEDEKLTASLSVSDMGVGSAVTLEMLEEKQDKIELLTDQLKTAHLELHNAQKSIADLQEELDIANQR